MPWVLIAGFSLKGYEWLYPIAQIDNDHAYVIHQASLHHIELWKWNIRTNHATKALLSTFMPAGLQVLPTGDGFSFVDNDKVCIKYDIKRSPKVIPLDAPLYNFTLVHWIDESHAYLSAYEHDTSNIYQIDLEGRTWCIVTQSSCDCMYPQKVGSTLFYLERYNDKTVLTSCTYPTLKQYGPEYEYSTKSHINWDTRQELLTIDGSLVFLNMISDSQGYVIYHDSHIDRYQKSIEFTYNVIFKNGGKTWGIRPCFSFSLPTSLLFGDDRLYESLLPFLPKVYGDSIYFVSLQEDQCGDLSIPNLSLFQYNCDDQIVTLLQKQYGQFLCSPYKINSSLYYGGSLKDCDTISMNIDDGYLNIHLPCVELQC